MKKSTSIIPLQKCPVCGGPEIMSRCLGDRRYRYTCCHCGQYFEFNARNQIQADRMWNSLFVR